MKKRVVISFIVGILGVSGVGLGTTYFLRDSLPITVCGNVYNYKDLQEELESYLKESNPVFDMKELNQYVTYNVDVDDLLNTGLFTRIDYAFTDKDNTLTYSVEFNKDKIRDYLNQYNLSADMPVNASITREDDSFELVPEISGSQVLVDKLVDSLNAETTNVKVEDYYLKPERTTKGIQKEYDNLMSFVNWSCTYSNGEQIKASPEYVNFDSETGEITVDDSWISQATREILKSYNTVGAEHDFTTHGGKLIKVSGGTWGSQPDLEKEVDFLKESFAKGESITDRVPEYTYSYETMTDTYIELSIADQHLWVYQDGNMIMETDVVTGDCTKKRDTPTGCYFISECINGKYLTGDNYKTWVNKWMRLTNQGVGLHDAGWQPYFGGSRYKGHGSHGCINLPPKFASTLFDTVSRGWLVVIY